jgi:hypothetical protein
VSLDNRANNSRNDGSENVAIGHEAILWIFFSEPSGLKGIENAMKAVTGSEDQ